VAAWGSMARMLEAKSLLLAVMGLFGVVFAAYWLRTERSLPAESRGRRIAPSLLETSIGFVTNFFDSLGIGSFAPTTSVFKLKHLVPDEQIPGTLNVGHTIPTIVQASIFITVVQVDVTTLALMIAASVVGAWFGAGIVAGWPRRKVRIGMGAALLVAALFFIMKNLDIAPGEGQALALGGTHLGIGLLGNLVLGALMTLGIGLYAPCMILVSLLGMDPKAAFPIMMGSCAFLMPVGSVRFLQKRSYFTPASIGLAIGGVPAVLIAGLLVKSLPMTTVRWLVVVVVLYTAGAMLYSAFRGDAKG
jgi:uncharacterized membrane protein YfcA